MFWIKNAFNKFANWNHIFFKTENRKKKKKKRLRTIMSAEREFPGDPVVKSVFSSAGGMGSIPFQGTKIPYAV